MNKQNYIRLKRESSFILAVIVISCVLGCSSIHSGAVRDLIKIETEKIDQASTNTNEFIVGTDKAIAAWETSVAALSESLQNQKTIESVHALIFSANQNIATKIGVDAHAAGYLIGELYLADRMGLEQVVRDQFTEDFKTLKELAEQINASWVALKKTQKEIDTYSNKSFLASVDAKLMSALLVEFGGDTDTIDEVLKRSHQVNEALKKASGLGLLEGLDSGRAQTVMEDVVNLLGRVKE